MSDFIGYNIIGAIYFIAYILTESKDEQGMGNILFALSILWIFSGTILSILKCLKS